MSADGKHEENGKSAAVKLGLMAIVGLVALTAIYLIASGGRGGNLEVSSGGVKFSQSPQDDFAEIVSNAIKADPGTVEVLLGQHGYYHINSINIVNAISDIDSDNPDSHNVTLGMRQLLWDLDGPFRRPGTLTGADERLIGALEELEEVLRESGETSKLLAELWQRSLERTSVFRPRSFKAEVELLSAEQMEAQQAAVIYACAGSVFIDKEMTLWVEGGGSVVTGRVAADVRRFDCGTSRHSLQELLAGLPARLALDAEVFSQLLNSAETDATAPNRIEAKFQVHPKNLTAAVQIP